MTASPTWPIDLSAPPQVRYGVARAVHGPGVQRFCLPGAWALHLYDYRAALRMGSHELLIEPGTFSVTPPGVEVVYRWRRASSHLCFHFSLAGDGEATCRLPALSVLGERFGDVRGSLCDAVNALQSQPARAAARLWDVLWMLSETTVEHADGALHPSLRSAVSFIESRLNGSLRVSDVVERAAISHNQLTRLFREAFGATIVGYIRRRRAQRACHLLTQTTMPIKAVAIEVGLADLQQFNKLIHRELGESPRALRRRR